MGKIDEVEAEKTSEFMVGCIGWILIGPLIEGFLFRLTLFLIDLFNLSTESFWPITFFITGILVLLYISRSWIAKRKWGLYGALVTMLANILGLLYSFKMYDYFTWGHIIISTSRKRVIGVL